MRIVIITSSLCIVLFVALSYLDEAVWPSWRDHQQRYSELAKSAGESESASFDLGLQQFDLAELGRVDRCTTCHIGIEDARMSEAPQPLTTHPGPYLADHDIRRFGCTVCHDGQGRAISRIDAHATARDVHFERPLLAPPFIEARCYRCHRSTLEATPVYNRGKALFESSGCLGCHRLDGKGGSLGPPLDALSDAAPSLRYPTDEYRAQLSALTGGNVNLAYLLESVQYPAAQPKDTRMFDYSLGEADAIALTVYMKSFEGTRISGRDYVPREVSFRRPDWAERGERLYGLYCSGCHGARGKGGRPNPNASAPTIPNLSALNERLMLFEREDAATFLKALIDSQGRAPDADSLDLPRSSVIAANFSSVWTVIQNGNPSGREDPNGPVPLDMPAWGGRIDADETVAIVAYLLSVGEYEDDEE